MSANIDSRKLSASEGMREGRGLAPALRRHPRCQMRKVGPDAGVGAKPLLLNPSCPLQALNREGQQEPDDLQLEALRRDRVDLLLGK